MKRCNLSRFLMFSIIIMMFVSCKKEKNESNLPLVKTVEVSNIDETTVTCGGNIASDGNSKVTERGVCWSAVSNATILGNHTSDGSGIGSFTSNISGLTGNMTYYVRAYATNSVGTAYGEEKVFKTKQTNNSLPTVSSATVSNISSTTATCGGNVTSDGNSAVTAKGVCWSTSQNPTIANNKTNNGQGLGAFTSNITGLTTGTTYYVRAYATNSVGTAYGEEKVFKTKQTNNSLPTVSSATVSNISSTTATCGGNVTSDGNSAVTTKGVCWSTSQNPTIANNKTNDGQGLGLFTSNITGLTSSTTYYVRAYATNSNGTSYGEQKSFKTTIHGMLNGVFSVSSTNKVCFSQGNLQYQASTNTWRFAANQYSIVGNAPGNTSPSATQSAWIDLFGWGTSGFNGKHPYNTSTNSSDYGPSGNGNISGTNYDWGVYNPISNGGNQSGMWRTLTQSEWYYLLFSRTNASDKYGLAKINGVPGLVILPDDWTLPNTCSFSAVKTSFDSNNYTLSQWNDMQTAGAVFLPAAGNRHLTTISNVGSYGYYWSTSYGNSGAYDLLFGTTSIQTWVSTGLGWGESVRMVRNQ